MLHYHIGFLQPVLWTKQRDSFPTHQSMVDGSMNYLKEKIEISVS